MADNPGDLDAEMITRLPVQLSIIGNLFMAIDGVVGGMHGADASAGRVSRRDSPRPGPDHTGEDDPGAGSCQRDEYMVSRTLTNLFRV